MASIAKIVSIFIIFTITFLFGLLPLALLKLFEKKFASKNKLRKWIGLLNCFSGGVFFGTAMLHLLPEAVEMIKMAFSMDYPIAEALSGAGFFLILLIENFIGSCGYGHSHMHDIGHDNPAHSVICVEEKPEEQTSTFTSESCEKSAIETNGRCGGGPSHSHGEEGVREISSAESGSKSAEKIKLEQNGDSQGIHSYGAIATIDVKTEENNKAHQVEVEEPPVVIEGHDPEFLAFRSVVLLIALSFHMIFEGLSVGLQQTDQDTWKLMGVLSLHKCIVAFSVGLQLAEGLKKLRHIIVSLVLLAVVAPIGVVIGYVVTEVGEDSNSEHIAAGVLQSLSIGSFIYVTFFEILGKELAKGRNLSKVLCTILGFAIVGGMRFTSDSH